MAIKESVKLAGGVITLATIVSMAVTTFLYMDSRHASEVAVLMGFKELDVEKADDKAKGYAELMYHYCGMVKAGLANAYESDRCNYSKEQMRRFQNEVLQQQTTLDQLKHK